MDMLCANRGSGQSMNWTNLAQSVDHATTVYSPMFVNIHGRPQLCCDFPTHALALSKKNQDKVTWSAPAWMSFYLQAIYSLNFPIWERASWFCSDRWLNSFIPATPACSNSLSYGICQYHWIVRIHALPFVLHGLLIEEAIHGLSASSASTVCA